MTRSVGYIVRSAEKNREKGEEGGRLVTKLLGNRGLYVSLAGLALTMRRYICRSGNLTERAEPCISSHSHFVSGK